MARKIRAVRHNYGFQGRYWHRGETTTVEGEVPDHFELVDKNVAHAPAPAPELEGDESEEAPSAQPALESEASHRMPPKTKPVKTKST